MHSEKAKQAQEMYEARFIASRRTKAWEFSSLSDAALYHYAALF